jgi:hypothetical protein
MGRVWDILRVRAAFDLEVEAPVDDVERRLRCQTLRARPSTMSRSEGYAGEVTEQGFAIRRFGHATSRGESRPAVHIRGEFRPMLNSTRVAVVIRHGLLLVSFGWLLVVMGLAGLANVMAGDRSPSLAIGAASVMALGVLSHLRLCWELGRVRREIVGLLSTEAQDGRSENCRKP